MLASAAVACMHSLVAVQALVLCAFITPNQDLAFVLAVSYDVLSSLLAGVWVHIGNLVRLFWQSPLCGTAIQISDGRQGRSCLEAASGSALRSTGRKSRQVTGSLASTAAQYRPQVSCQSCACA